MRNFGVNDGHTISGPGSGAVGKIREGEQTRLVGNEVRRLFIERGENAINCTVDYANTTNDSLSLVVQQANRHELDWFIAIHFNAGGGKGVEVYTYEGRQYLDAVNVCNNISALGFTNRGVKAGTGLYVISKTKAKSMLIEVCFVDTNDADKYMQVGYKAIAKAIVDGILGAIPELENAQIYNLNVEGNLVVGNNLIFKAEITPDTLCKFVLQRKSNGEWIPVRDYEELNYCYHTFSTQGEYLLSCNVKRKGSNEDYDNYEHYNFTIGEIKKATIDKFESIGALNINTPIVFKTTATQDSEYKYYIYDYEANEWLKMIDYSYYTEFKHTFASKKKFRVVVHVKNKYSNNEYDDRAEIELDFTKDENHINCEKEIDQLKQEVKTLTEINKELQSKLEKVKEVIS